MPRVLILGKTGQLARALQGLSWPPRTELRCLGSETLGDETPGAAAAAAIAESGAALVLNAAAYTAVDRAETEPTRALALNADLPLAVAVACSRHGVPLVHISTDYVFDGAKQGAYLESDAPNPLSAYGRSKLAGDRNIEAQCTSPWAILRTSWVFSAAADSFPARILKRARAGEHLRVVDDQTGCPTPSEALARAMQQVGLRLLDRDPKAQGLFNFCGAEAMSWHGFAARILAEAERAGMAPAVLEAIGSDAYPTPARRPRNSVLDCGRIGRQCGIAAASLGDALPAIVRAILA